MPIHEYQCEDCKHIFEQLTFRGDRDPVVCPKCDQKNCNKLVSASSFKGLSGLAACLSNRSSRSS